MLSLSGIVLASFYPPVFLHASIFLGVVSSIFFTYILLVYHSFLDQSFWRLTCMTGSYCHIQHLATFSLCSCGGDTNPVPYIRQVELFSQSQNVTGWIMWEFKFWSKLLQRHDRSQFLQAMHWCLWWCAFNLWHGNNGKVWQDLF